MFSLKNMPAFPTDKLVQMSLHREQTGNDGKVNLKQTERKLVFNWNVK